MLSSIKKYLLKKFVDSYKLNNRYNSIELMITAMIILILVILIYSCITGIIDYIK